MLTNYLFLNTHDANKFLERWRPQLVASQLVSVTGINSYSRARIQLSYPNCVGMLINARNMGIVLHKKNETVYQLGCCLWPSGSPIIDEFREFREWCDCMLPLIHMDGDILQDDDERELWTLSEYNT
jgi:hypothetical protein